MKDFTHIAYVGGAPIVITAHASLGVKSLAELVAMARRRGNALGYVSPGVGSLGHMVGEYLARKDDIRLEHIPYKGGVQAVTDLIAGHVKVGAMTWTTTRPHIRTGMLTALAVSSARRFADDPDLPTLRELGYGELVTTTWWSFSGPAKLPPRHRPAAQSGNQQSARCPRRAQEAGAGGDRHGKNVACAIHALRRE